MKTKFTIKNPELCNISLLYFLGCLSPSVLFVPWELSTYSLSTHLISASLWEQGSWCLLLSAFYFPQLLE